MLHRFLSSCELKHEIFIPSDWWRRRQRQNGWENQQRPVAGEEGVRAKKSNLFVRCLYDSINPPTENVICIHRSLFCCFSTPGFFAFLSSKAKALRRHKSFIQNHSIVFLSRNFFICVRESFYFVFDGETLRSVMKCKSSFWRISRGVKRWKGKKQDRFNKLGG